MLKSPRHGIVLINNLTKINRNLSVVFFTFWYYIIPIIFDQMLLNLLDKNIRYSRLGAKSFSKFKGKVYVISAWLYFHLI